MQCASYAYGRAIELGYFGNLQGLGSLIRNGAPDHAKDWDDNVGSANWKWQPRRHSIVVWDDGAYGHVAFVEAVNYHSDGSVASFVISEHNRNLDEKFGSRTIYSSQSSFKAKFIYLSGDQPPPYNPEPIPDNNALTNYPVFDAGYYLSVHSDVANAYGSTNYEGAKSHWLNFGIKEGRKSSPFFDGSYYLSKNADVAAVYGSTNYEGAISHWLTYGINEGRRASQEFDPIYYMAAHPDVEAAYGLRNFRGAMDHFQVWGKPGGWYGSEFVTDPYVFDWNDYLSRNQDVASVVNPSNSAVEATRHWYFNGINEGRRGSFEFDSRYYLARWEDVRAAFGTNNYRGAMDHYLIYGKNDSRIGANDEPRYLSILF